MDIWSTLSLNNARLGRDQAKYCKIGLSDLRASYARYAIANGLADRNLVAEIKPSDILKSSEKTNYARISAQELPELLKKWKLMTANP